MDAVVGGRRGTNSGASPRRTPANYTARAREAREERASLGRQKERARLGFYREREGEQRSPVCFMAAMNGRRFLP
jgi:hypothetical protein